MANSASPSEGSDASASTDQPRPPVRGWVLAAGFAAISLFIGAVAVLYVQWVRYDNPNANITLLGNAQLDEATVTVTALGGMGKEPLIAQFKNGKDHCLRFHLPPGAYTVVVRDVNSGLIFPERPDREFVIDALRPLIIRLSLKTPSTRAGSPPMLLLCPHSLCVGCHRSAYSQTCGTRSVNTLSVGGLLPIFEEPS